MTSKDFVDLQPLQALLTKSQLIKFKYKEGHMFLYSESFKQGMKIWQAYEQELSDPACVKLQKGKGSQYDPSKFDFGTVQLVPKYPNGVKLKQEKIADLEHLLRFIPHLHRPWYNDLFVHQRIKRS